MSDIAFALPVILRNEGREILAHVDSLALPRLLPLGSGDTCQASEEFRLRFGASFCILFTFQNGLIAPPSAENDLTLRYVNSERATVLVGELWRDTDSLPEELCWIPTFTLRDTSFAAQSVLMAVQWLWDRMLKKKANPFECPGWKDDLIAFNGIAQSTETTYEQKCIGEHKATIKMSNAEGCVWLKASAFINTPPMRFVQTLNHLTVPHMPETLGFLSAESGWDAIAQENVQGAPLTERSAKEPWLQAARYMAEIQISLLSKLDVLRLHHLPEFDVATLRRQAGWLFTRLSSDAARQTHLAGQNIHLRVLATMVDEALDDEQLHGLPNTISLLQFDGDDVVIHPERGPIFVSWSKAAISSPLLWWHRFESSLPIEIRKNDIREAYLQVWSEHLGKDRNAFSCEKAGLLANLQDAISNAFAEGDESPEFDSYFPEQIEEWCWCLRKDSARLSSLQMCLRKLMGFAEAREEVMHVAKSLSPSLALGS